MEALKDLLCKFWLQNVDLKSEWLNKMGLEIIWENGHPIKQPDFVGLPHMKLI